MTNKTIPIAFGFIGLAIVCWIAAFFADRASDDQTAHPTKLFAIQSIDTMKQSRDMARSMASDPSADAKMAEQMRLIKDAGATHVAINTPYDDEFAPMLRRWVSAARAEGLSVWFRGNFSGWEGWFDYQKIDAETHRRMLGSFIERNDDLFQDGDAFSPCPECENGGPGDPRSTKDKEGYGKMLVDEYRVASDAFGRLGKDMSILSSMNADVARESIDAGVVSKLGGTVLVDHYVKSPEALAKDVGDIGRMHKGAVGVGEFGAPIPDIHGDMDEGAQAEFVRATLDALASRKEANIVNYWVLEGGSTAIVSDSGTPKRAYETIKAYYSPLVVSGQVKDSLGDGINHAKVTVQGSGIQAETDRDGRYRILVPRIYDSLLIGKDGFTGATARVSETATSADAILSPTNPSIWYKIRSKISTL